MQTCAVVECVVMLAISLDTGLKKRGENFHELGKTELAQRKFLNETSLKNEYGCERGLCQGDWFLGVKSVTPRFQNEPQLAGFVAGEEVDVSHRCPSVDPPLRLTITFFIF